MPAAGNHDLVYHSPKTAESRLARFSSRRRCYTDPYPDSQGITDTQVHSPLHTFPHSHLYKDNIYKKIAYEQK